MHSFIASVGDFIQPPYDADEVYGQRDVVDLNANFDQYNFAKYHPAAADIAKELFDLVAEKSSGESVTARSLLMSPTYSAEEGQLLAKMGFSELKPQFSKSGVTLTHPNMPGWVIKKNFGWDYCDGKGNSKGMITKCVAANGIPTWMFPPELRSLPKGKKGGLQLPNDVINPLRAVMSERGKHWIKNLKLNFLQAADEYLLPITSAEKHLPLHDRVVVLSRLEKICDGHKHLSRLVQLANANPEKLAQIARQIALFITCNPLTDLYLHNARFLDDETDTLFFMDNEPVGGVAEASDQPSISAIRNYDRGCFPILGLRKLQASIAEEMEGHYATSDIEKVQKIFDHAIDTRVRVIAWERSWLWLKAHIAEWQLMLISTIFQAAQTVMWYLKSGLP